MSSDSNLKETETKDLTKRKKKSHGESPNLENSQRFPNFLTS